MSHPAGPAESARSDAAEGTTTSHADHNEPDKTVPETLPLLPLSEGVVLPEMVVTMSIQSAEAASVIDDAADRLLLVPRLAIDEQPLTAGAAPDSSARHRYARVGVIATIEDRATLPNGTPAVTIRAHGRARVGTAVIGATAGLWVEAEPIVDPEPTEEVRDLASTYRAAATNLLEKVGGRRLSSALREIETPGALADSIGYWPELTSQQRIELLETTDVAERLRLATSWVTESLAEIETRERIQREVTDDLEKSQREAILRRQMAAIKSELDEGDEDVIGTYRARLDEITTAAAEANRPVPEATVDAITREIDRLERTGNESMEANWIRTWLDTVFELPWGEHSEEQLDLEAARQILDADHTGLDDVKERLVEFLAIRKLRAERSSGQTSDAAPRGRRQSGAILALVGPPGVGKTSLGESVARALGRSFVRVSLGGVRDEAEIRGHRRTYVGARPGRLVRAFTEAGSMNPVVLLDEIDKVGNGWQGDPSAALLEVLDPAQNATFRDHYLEFDLDLSDTVFLATANVLDTIPGPLLDRMEVIRLDGYTATEKAAIATDHLLPRLVEGNGLETDEIELTSGAIETIASDYTREAGVRNLERLIDKVVRKAATRIAGGAATPIVIKPDQLTDLLGRSIPSEDVIDRIDRPGIVAGLAVTGAGGDVLIVETALVDGTGDPLLTGQLGEVMQESASIARSIIGAHGHRWGISLPDDKRIHVHFPAGAVPKDGPSAGIAMTTALVSLLTDTNVRNDVAMTGEVTLQGRVLPIGGVKQKVLAAHRAGVRTVLLPIGNAEDVDDIPTDIRDQMTIHLVTEIDEVLELALTDPA